MIAAAPVEASAMAERLSALRREHEIGSRRLAVLERERLQLRDVLLRIGGAIQVLEELQADGGEGTRDR